MQFLKFNNELVDIDDRTSIGINVQAYDVKKPGERKLNVSNNFTIPLTVNNNRICGFVGSAQSNSTVYYSSFKCEYNVDNYQLIKGIVYITSVSDRINCTIINRADVFQSLSEISWKDFQSDFIEWYQTEYFTGDYGSFVEQYINSTEGIHIPMYVGNLYEYDNSLESASKILLQYQNLATVGLGGHICVYVKTIFEFIEYKYGVDFGTSRSFDYNIFEDAFATKIYTPFRNIWINKSANLFWFQVVSTVPFLPEEDKFTDCENKTPLDFIRSFFQHFNCVVDFVNDKYYIRRFDDIKNAEIEDFSLDIIGAYEFKPSITGYNQNNYIKFANVYDGGNPLTNSKYLKCFNKNINIGSADSSLFDIEAYIGGQFIAGGSTVTDLSKSEAIDSFTFLIDDISISGNVNCMFDGIIFEHPTTIKVARHYSLDSEYNTLEEVIQYPKMYTIRKLLNIVDIHNIEFFKRYRVNELNGYFYINKISGFNPQRLDKASVIELINIP